MTNFTTWRSLIDGQEVSALPDSVIHHWKFDEGSGGAVADNIGDADGSVNGPSWVSGNFEGGSALEADGTDDHVSTTTLGNFGSNMSSDFAVSFTIKSPNDGDGWVMGMQNDATDFDTGDQTHFSVRNDDGQIRWEISDEDNEIGRARHESDINDNEPHRVVINKSGNTHNDVLIYIDTIEDTSVFNTSSWDTFNNFEFDFPFFAFIDDDGLDRYGNFILDDILIFNDSLTSTEIQDDFDRQPWS